MKFYIVTQCILCTSLLACIFFLYATLTVPMLDIDPTVMIVDIITSVVAIAINGMFADMSI